VEIIFNFGKLALRLIPILVAAVLLAELARLWLGEDRLRKILSGSRPWEGRFRAALLGAVLPFCECGAFPIMVGLLRAGIPLKLALTFFVISPIVSIPAFLFLMGIFGWMTAALYMVIAVFLGLVLSSLLASYGNAEEIIRNKFAGVQENQKGCGSSVEGTTCCSEAKENSIFQSAWNAGVETLKKIIPYALAAMFIAALMQTYISEEVFQRIFNMAALYSVPVAAVAGIPIYGADCTKISIIAPFLEVTQAIGPGIAFIMAGAGTSINGLVFMSSIFSKKFLGVFVLGILFAAIVTGFLMGFLP